MLSLKSTAQNALKKIHLYERAKTSHLYELYWKFVDREVIDARDCEVEFYRDLLKGFPKNGLIFDIGANQGSKTEIFLRLGARVVAVDPDETNQAILEEKFRRYRFVRKPVFIVGKAASDKNGSETFWLDEPGSGKNTLNGKWVKILQADESKFGRRLAFEQSAAVETVTLECLIARYGLPFFVKIDVEGHELNVLRGLQRPVPYLSFEINLPEFKEEGLRCLELLKSLSPSGHFNFIINSQAQFAGEAWMDYERFQRVLHDRRESSIEVFWKTAK